MSGAHRSHWRHLRDACAVASETCANCMPSTALHSFQDVELILSELVAHMAK